MYTHDSVIQKEQNTFNNAPLSNQVSYHINMQSKPICNGILTGFS